MATVERKIIGHGKTWGHIEKLFSVQYLRAYQRRQKKIITMRRKLWRFANMERFEQSSLNLSNRSIFRHF